MAHRNEDPTLSVLRQGVRAPLPITVRVVGGTASPRVFRLVSGSCVVGAGGDADIVVDDKTVSRNHVALELVPEGVQLVDSGSRNGTFYLGQRVQRMTLAPGSRIRVGSAELLLEASAEPPDQRVADLPTAYGGMVGTSAPMRKLFATLARLEGSLVNVLVQGESGVGKELVAQAIHAHSTVANAPFVAVNCGALPRELAASELFGHKKGAFTGAIEPRRGAFDRADGGTLFLDEIGELPVDVQPMLLRVLESAEVRAVGDDQTRHVNVRVIAASNRVLVERVRAGLFREDLYFRVAVVTLTVAPLRDRPDDVALLAERFAARQGASLPESTLHDLAGRRWPGNVRELRNAVQAFLALGDAVPPEDVASGSELDAALRKCVDLDRPYASQKEALAGRFTRVYLESLMRRADGNQTDAAQIAGLDRGYLGRLLAKHGMGRPSR